MEVRFCLFCPIFSAQTPLNGCIQLHFPPKIGTKNPKIILSKQLLNTLLAGLKSISKNLEKVAPGNDCVMIGMFKETKGTMGDLYDVLKQKVGIKTPEVILGREILTTFAEMLERIHPLNTLTSVAHSGGGSWLQGALNCMNTEQKERMRNRILSVNIAPASCVSNETALRATNFYSKNDLITGVFGVSSMPTVRAVGGSLIAGVVGAYTSSRSTYNVTFLESNRPISQGPDHSFIDPTQQDALNIEFRELEKDYGFYKKAR